MTDAIPIRNLYYMLAYAYRCLDQRDFSGLEAEPFENACDLFATILARGLSGQIRRGLERSYVPRQETLSAPRGRIDVSASIKEQSLARLRLPCRYDEYSEDIPANQVMKLTARYLCRSGQVCQSRRDALKRLLPFLSGVSDLSPGSVRWDQVKCRPDNRPCRSLIGICRLVMEHLLFANPDGSREIRGYMDGQPMHLLYEKFILEYYRRHFPGLSPNPELIRWNVTGGQALHLPLMRTDLVLRGAGKTLIIDAKYYSHSMQSYRDPDSPTIRSGNLYQIYAYAKNLDRDRTGSVAGLLLYARTKEPVVPDDSCEIDGTLIAAKTLDLSLPFPEIAGQLDRIAQPLLDKPAHPWNTAI